MLFCSKGLPTYRTSEDCALRQSIFEKRVYSSLGKLSIISDKFKELMKYYFLVKHTFQIYCHGDPTTLSILLKNSPSFEELKNYICFNMFFIPHIETPYWAPKRIFIKK